MDFSLTPEELLIQNFVRRFARERLLPNYRQRAKSSDFSWGDYKQIADLGLLGMRVEEKYGGQPASFVTCGIAIEEISKADINSALSIFSSIFIGEFLSLSGTKEQKDDYLPAVANGKTVMALGMTEPNCGSDVAAISTRAVAEGNNFVLTGEKSSTSFIMVADCAIVFAKTESELGTKGISCFIVPLNLPGLHRYLFNDLGGHPIQRGGFSMDNVRVPKINLIGEIGQGFSIAAQGFDFSKVLISLATIGTAEAALDMTLKYVKERTAFGKAIGNFQGVSFPIAEHKSVLETIKLLCYKALWMKDNGLDHSVEAAMCKLMAPRAATEIIHNCLLLHGHMGYSDEFPLGQMLCDVIGYEIMEGPAQIQKLIILKNLLGKEFVK